MKNITITTNENEVAEAIKTAQNCPAATEGWEKVIWANKMSPRARKVSYGFNYQQTGTRKVGEVIENAWSGNSDHAKGNVCKVLAIL